jgi:hypothetical protein
VILTDGRTPAGRTPRMTGKRPGGAGLSLSRIPKIDPDLMLCPTNFIRIFHPGFSCSTEFAGGRNYGAPQARAPTTGRKPEVCS